MFFKSCFIARGRLVLALASPDLHERASPRPVALRLGHCPRGLCSTVKRQRNKRLRSSGIAVTCAKSPKRRQSVRRRKRERAWQQRVRRVLMLEVGGQYTEDCVLLQVLCISPPVWEPKPGTLSYCFSKAILQIVPAQKRFSIAIGRLLCNSQYDSRAHKVDTHTDVALTPPLRRACALQSSLRACPSEQAATA